MSTRSYYNVTAFLLGLCAIGIVVGLLRMRRLRPWDAAMFAVAPGFLLTATINWDLLAALFVVFALYAWGRKMPVLTGILIGLGAATKLWPALLLVPIVLIAWRARKLGDALFAVSIAVLTWLAVNLPVMLPGSDSGGSSSTSTDAGTSTGARSGTSGARADPTTARVTAVHQLGSHPCRHRERAVVPLFAPGLRRSGAVDVLAPRRPRVAQLAFLTVAVFLIFSKVWSQQYVLWLLPLAILARPRWTAFLAWQCAELCYFFAFDGELMRADGNPIFPEGVFVIAASLRLITLIVLCAYVVRDVLHPERDVVLETYGDDPDGGVFVDAEDRWEVMAGLAPPAEPTPVR